MAQGDAKMAQWSRKMAQANAKMTKISFDPLRNGSDESFCSKKASDSGGFSLIIFWPVSNKIFAALACRKFNKLGAYFAFFSVIIALGVCVAEFRSSHKTISFFEVQR